MDEKILRGIKACYHEINGKNEFTVGSGTVIYLLSGRKHRFVVENNPQILGEKTTNPESTITNAKWAFILSYLWSEAIKTKEGEDLPLWADLGGGKENINELGIGQQYKAGKSIEITPDQNDVWLGNFHRMEVFSTRPNKGLFFYFVTIDKPKIYLAYFDKQNIKPEVKDFTINDGYYSYGEVIKFYVATHMLPMKIGEQYSEKYGKIDTETSFENLEFEIELTDENHNPLLDEPILKGKLVDYSPIVKDAEGYTRISTGTANIQYEFPILIDSKWKDDIHTKDEKTKTYSVTIKITNTKTKKEYSYTPDLSSIRRIADNNRDFDDVEVSPVFMVKYESMDTILSQMEEKKNNMIQYIGDIDYNYKETNPCAYSKIVINNGEKDFEIFNEYALTGKEVKDKTDKFLDIVCGDKETKDIKVTAKFLKSKNAQEEHVRTDKNGFKCQMILNDGNPHNGVRDVFKMEWVVGQWVPSKDPALFAEHYMKKIGVKRPQFFHPSNGASSPKIEWDKSDQEAKGIESSDKKNYENITVAGVQGLVEGTGYTISEANDSITLKLKYKYNKTVMEGVQVYTSSSSNNALINTLWLFRYFILNEKKAQIHFVPVTTCRYPNQIAKFRIFPDIEWELAALVSVGLTKKVFKFQSTRESLNGFHKNYNFKYVNQELKIDASAEEKIGADFRLKASASGEVFDLGYKIEKSIKKVIGTFNAVYKGIKIFDGTNEDVTKSAAYKKGSLKKFEFSIDPPNVAIALKWKYALAKKEENLSKVGWRMEGGVALKPFMGIGITIDLVPIVGKFGWIGKEVKLIIKALEYTVKGIDIFFNFKLNAEIAEQLSIAYHSIDGWDNEAKREITFTVRASLEAGVNYEGTELISTIVENGVTYETKEELKIKASLGTGVEYKEDWNSDENGIYKNITVTFLGAEAKLEVYSSITRRKKTVYNDDEVVSNQKGDIKHNDVHKLLEKDVWYGPKKIYTDDEKDDQ